jgi:hypothetical protein
LSSTPYYKQKRIELHKGDPKHPVNRSEELEIAPIKLSEGSFKRKHGF